MNARDHLIIGIVSAGVALGTAELAGGELGPFGLVVGPTIAGVGALAPDIDHKDSWIGSRIPLTLGGLGLMLLFMPLIFTVAGKSDGMMSAIWEPVSAYYGTMLRWGALLLGIAALLLAVSILVTRSVRHRGATHSLTLAVGAGLVAFLISLVTGLGPWMGLMFGLGWTSHLIGDAITPHGLPSLLWPLTPEREKGAMRSFGFLLIPLLIFGMLGWWQVVRRDETVPTAPQSVVSTPASTPVRASETVDVALARQQLRDAAPDIEAALVHPDEPKVSTEGDWTSYTWEYVQQDEAASAWVKSITITLDASGNLVGATQQ